MAQGYAQNPISKTDDAAFTVAADKVQVIGGVATSDTVDSGDAAALAVTTARAAHVNLRNASGTELGVAGSGVVVDTELPAAAALADNTANPTVPSVGALLMAMDSGGTWDRVRGDSAKGLFVTASHNGTSSVTSVAGSASSVTLLSASAARQFFSVYNDSSAVLYIKLGTTASSSDFSVKLYPEGYYENDHYVGRIDAIWASATGNARITELT